MNKPGNSLQNVADGQSSDLFSGKASSSGTQKAAASSKGKVRVSADTERGEATGIGGIGAPGVMGGAKPGSMPGKGSLAMAGGNILDDARPQKSTLLKKKTDAAAGNPQNATAQNQAQNKKNPFTQRRQTAGQSFPNSELANSGPGVGDDSDDSDEFDEFYLNNQPKAAQKGSKHERFDENVRKFHNDKSFMNTDYNAGAYNDEATLKGTTGGRGSFNPGTGGGTGAAFNSGDLSAQLNRNMSQSHLSAAANAAEATQSQMDAQKEVELKAQGENSQLFQDSLQQQTANQSVISHHARQSRLGQSNQLSGAGAAIMSHGHQNFQGFSSGSGAFPQEARINLNLEDVVLHEQKLSTILDNLRNDVNASLSCEDWWDLTETTDLYNIICLKLIRDVQMRQLMIQAQKYETIAVGIVQFYHLIASEQATIDTKTSVNTYLKNLLHYIHQNFLVAAKFIHSRIINKEGNLRNVWIQNLKKAVDGKIVKTIKNKSEAVQMLRVNIENSDNIIRNIIKANQRKQFFIVLNMYVTKMPLFPNDKIRDTLYNIEQFKFDAMLQPEIRMGMSSSSSSSTNSSSSTKSGGSQGANQMTASNSSADKDKSKSSHTASGMAKKIIKDSDKSSGTNNLVGTGGGNSTLTGKNPFAILKASAIAATQKAVFPNNFTNLPKATPPFLPPLEGKEKDSIYTLVLDLDETLIHNVEYGQDSFFLVRPGCVQFIELMAQYYEIVIFTAALQEYADQVVDQIDVSNNIRHRLYRQHTSQNGPFLVKDLSLLGRDLKHTIIIDNISDNFILQPDNGIFISTWYDDMSDNFLKEITPLLVELVEKRVPDVRVGMRSYRDQILRQISSGSTSNTMPSIKFK